jgi:hypothetical protein
MFSLVFCLTKVHNTHPQFQEAMMSGIAQTMVNFVWVIAAISLFLNALAFSFRPRSSIFDGWYRITFRLGIISIVVTAVAIVATVIVFRSITPSGTIDTSGIILGMVFMILAVLAAIPNVWNPPRKDDRL